MARARLHAGQTQAQLAEAMATKQPAIARAEAGYRMPTIAFIDRWARATGEPIKLELGPVKPQRMSAARRQALVRSVLGPGHFDPWDRNPTTAEAELLKRTGLDREHFDRLKRQRAKRNRSRPAPP